MSKKHERGRILAEWRGTSGRGVTCSELAARFGAAPKGTLAKFEAGERDLSIPLCAEVCLRTGISMPSLLSKNQLAQVRLIVAAMGVSS